MASASIKACKLPDFGVIMDVMNQITHVKFLKNKIWRKPDGSEIYFMTGKCSEDGKNGIWLINNERKGKEPDYSLWYVELNDGEEGELKMQPYNGEDNETLINELLEDFIEKAFVDE